MLVNDKKKITEVDIFSFRDKIGKPFVGLVKDNIPSRFSTSKYVITFFRIFDPKIIPNLTPPELLSYGEDSIETLIDHYAQDLLAETVQGVEFIKEAKMFVQIGKHIVN